MEPFLKARIIFAFFKNVGKSSLSKEALIEGKKTKYVKRSAVSLIIFVGTSVSCHAFDASKPIISLNTSSLSTLLKLNSLSNFETFSIAFILG